MLPEGDVEMKVEMCGRRHVRRFYVPLWMECEPRACPVCDGPTMSECPECGAPIGLRAGGPFVAPVRERDLRPSRHCRRCGAALLRAGARSGAAWQRRLAARARGHVWFRVEDAARAASRAVAEFASGAGRAAGTLSGVGAAADTVRAAGASYAVRRDPDWMRFWLVSRTARGWDCGCGGGARCEHVWAAMLAGRLDAAASKLGAPRRMREAEISEGISSSELLEREGSASARRLAGRLSERAHRAWGDYLEWEGHSNYDMEMAVDAAEVCPGRAMRHAQQAAEKQIKAVRAYYERLGVGNLPRSLGHDIFAKEFEPKLVEMLSKDGCRHELKMMTMGMRVDPAGSEILRHMYRTPAIVAYGADMDLDVAMPERPWVVSVEWHLGCLQRALAPLRFQPTELACPTREYVPDGRPWAFGGLEGMGDVLHRLEGDEMRVLDSAMPGGWHWRYYALYVHEDARYPSKFAPLYAKHADIVKRWVFEAGFMTSRLQNEARARYAMHTTGKGGTRGHSLGPVRDDSWYAGQARRLTGDEYWHLGGT